jgi:hypothetical protein
LALVEPNRRALGGRLRLIGDQRCDAIGSLPPAAILDERENSGHLIHASAMTA